MNIIVVGKQSYLVRQTIEDLVTKEIGTPDDFNYEVADMYIMPVKEIVNSIMTLPLGSEKKVVIVKHPFMLLGDKPTRFSLEYNDQTWLDYLEESYPHATVIFECIGDKLDETKAVTKAMKKKSKLITVDDINKKDWKSYIEDALHTAGIRFEPAIVDILEKRLQHDVQLLHNEIEKFALFGERITRQVADVLVPQNSEDDVFTLTNAVLDRKLSPALGAYRELKYTRKIADAVEVITQLASNLRLHYQVSILDRQGMNEGQIAQHLGVHPYRVKLAVQRSRHTTSLQFLELIDQLNTLDIDIKRGQIDSHQSFELFLIANSRAS